jgi:hypothetical protein
MAAWWFVIFATAALNSFRCYFQYCCHGICGEIVFSEYVFAL